MTTYVSADWVAARISDPSFLIIDTRYSMRHLMGHLQHAVNVPPPKLRDLQGQLLSPDGFSDLFGAAGLGDLITPILYDGYDGRNSALVAWILEYLGRDDTHPLCGYRLGLNTLKSMQQAQSSFHRNRHTRWV